MGELLEGLEGSVCFSLIRGSPEDSFPLLRSYFHMLKVRNPGTVTHIEVDDNKKFKFLFVALNVAIRGFTVMRKVIGLDGTFFTSTCKGMLLIATCKDGNFHCYIRLRRELLIMKRMSRGTTGFLLSSRML